MIAPERVTVHGRLKNSRVFAEKGLRPGSFAGRPRNGWLVEVAYHLGSPGSRAALPSVLWGRFWGQTRELLVPAPQEPNSKLWLRVKLRQSCGVWLSLLRSALCLPICGKLCKSATPRGRSRHSLGLRRSQSRVFWGPSSFRWVREAAARAERPGRQSLGPAPWHCGAGWFRGCIRRSVWLQWGGTPMSPSAGCCPPVKLWWPWHARQGRTAAFLGVLRPDCRPAPRTPP